MPSKSDNNLSFNRSVIVTSALPYANGEIHLGHVASTYLPADIFTRYLKLSGREVYHLCASDDFGTPILIKAEALRKNPEDYVKYWHDRDTEDFKSIGISFDLFSQTSSSTNAQFVQCVFKILQKNGYIYENDVIQFYCETDLKFLPDRYVMGKCPFCGAEDQYSDLCEKCGRIPDKIIDPKCAVCGLKPVIRKSRHYFFSLSTFSKELENWLIESKSLQSDVKKYVLHWIREGLHDWDITRDISWGIKIPTTNNKTHAIDESDNCKMESKVFYGWFDNHLCYISTLADLLGGLERAKSKWNDSEIYHFIGKDIVYHHYLFLPAIRMGMKNEYKLPDFIPTRGHLMLENQKISKSRNWYIGLKDFVKEFDRDYLRFYIASISSYSQDDVNFDWDSFAEKINNELINNIGNFINRTLSFCQKYFDKIPEPSDYDKEDQELIDRLTKIGGVVGHLLENNEVDKALKEILTFSSFLNQCFQRKQPWRDPQGANTLLFIAINAVRSLAIMLEPFIPFSAEKIWLQLGIDRGGDGRDVHIQKWESLDRMCIKPGESLGKVEPLFKKIEPTQINSQKQKLEIAIKNAKV